jgi:tRNA-dependent cyclodipeptide synthase
MTKYKIRVKSCPNWRDYQRACLAISVGKSAHEGGKLEAAVDWINRNFDSCIVDCSDTLQRWNLLNMSMDTAHAETLRWGDEWLRRNKAILARLTIPTKIIRWDHWLDHPEFAATHEAFKFLYQNHTAFRAALDQDTEDFLARQVGGFDKAIIIASSRGYILEEIAAHTLLNRELPAAKIYPSHSLEALRVVREGLIREAPKGLEGEYHTRITFDRIDEPVSTYFVERQAA